MGRFMPMIVQVATPTVLIRSPVRIALITKGILSQIFLNVPVVLSFCLFIAQIFYSNIRTEIFLNDRIHESGPIIQDFLMDFL